MVQAVHAAFESGKHFSNPTLPIDSTVICEVDSVNSLLLAREKIEYRGIKTILFKEPDIGNLPTAFATEPINSQCKKFLSKYKLWKGGQDVVD